MTPLATHFRQPSAGACAGRTCVLTSGRIPGYMPSTIEILNQKIEEKHLLKNAFYQAWTKGELSLDDLRSYSRQYFAQVRAFPAYLSEMHSRCENLDSRRVIARNLADEEATSPTHPELWLDFAAGLGESREAVLNHPAGPRFQALVTGKTKAIVFSSPPYLTGIRLPEKMLAMWAAANGIWSVQDGAHITRTKRPT